MNLVNNILLNCKNNGDKIAILDDKQSISYSQLKNYIKIISSYFEKKKIKPGDKIIIVLGNTIEQIIFHYSAIYYGLISIPMNRSFLELNYKYINHSIKPSFFFLKKKLNKNLKTKQILVNDINNFVKLNKVRINNFKIKNKANDISTILFTSGSDGNPKGVCLSHSSIINSTKNISSYLKYNNNNSEVIALPIHHSFGLGHIQSIHFSGGTIKILNGFMPLKKFINSFDANINGTALTPSFLNFLIKNFPKIAKKKFKNLKYIVINSEPMNISVLKFLKKFYPKMNIFFYYGLTEASRSTFINLSKCKKSFYSSVGKPTTSKIKIKILNDEILIKGNNLFSGYWGHKKKFTPKNWFPTGDLGFIKNEYLFIKGRKKNIINVGGYKVSTIEISNIIMNNFNKVLDCYVMGIKNRITGQTPLIFIKSNKNIDKSKIENFLINKIGPFARPKEIILIDKMPRTANGKILEKKLFKYL